MRFFYAQRSCSAASHIVLEEAGASYEAIELDFSAGEQRGEAFLAVNPRGKVPVLCDGAETITENVAIQYYLTEKFPEAGLRPADTVERVKWLSTITWLSSTVQPDARHITRPENYTEDPAGIPAIVRKGEKTLVRLMGEIDSMLCGKPWLMGEQYTTADPYALVFVGVAKTNGIDLSPFGSLAAWRARMLSRPAVRKVLESEANALIEPA